MAVTIRLYDPVTTESSPDPSTYTGRWTLTVDPFSLPPGAAGNVNAVTLDIPSPVESDTYFVFELGNDSGTPADLPADGISFDSDDSPPAWVTWVNATRFGDGASPPAEWMPVWAETVSILDGDWDQILFPGGYTIDPASDPSWFPPPSLLYEVRVVDMEGASLGTLDDARVNRLSWELNGAGAAEIALATTDPDAALMVPGREIQIFYQGGTDPLFWGPIVRPQAGLHETTWQCAGLLWYFAHRYMGRADRVNQLLNGEFEDGEDDWTFENGVTHSIDTGTVISGNSLELEGSVADHDEYAAQTWTHPAGGYPGGDAITVSTWVWISDADYLGPAIEDFGLVARHRSSTGEAINAQVATIDDDTERDKWIPLEVTIPVVEEGDTIDVLLFPPHGIAFFDLVTLTFMESLAFGYPATPVDVTTIIEGIVDYAQDRAPYDFGHGKSDLNIDTAGAATGTTRRIAYQFAEHRNILDAILEYVREGLADIDIAITATTRTFTVYPKSTDARTPKLGKGSLYGTTLELDVNLADFTWSWDLEQAASSVVILGPGDGPDRPEGGAADASLLGGAFTLELVEQAPDATTIGELDLRAAEQLKVAARPEILEVTTLPGAGIIGSLKVGDTVPVVIATGWVDIDATYRVASIEPDLPKDQATITLNPLP